jgi:hypothetical protein
MNAILTATVASGLASLSRVLDTPVEPFGFGADLSCASDLDEEMLELDGDDPLVLAQALVRRLDCPRGGLPDDPDYGIDLRAFLNEGTPFYELDVLGVQIQSELSKDDRVASVKASVTRNTTGSELTVSIRVVPADPATKPFGLTLAVTSTAVILEKIGAAA